MNLAGHTPKLPVQSRVTTIDRAVAISALTTARPVKAGSQHPSSVTDASSTASTVPGRTNLLARAHSSSWGASPACDISWALPVPFIRRQQTPGHPRSIPSPRSLSSRVQKLRFPGGIQFPVRKPGSARVSPYCRLHSVAERFSLHPPLASREAFPYELWHRDYRRPAARLETIVSVVELLSSVFADMIGMDFALDAKDSFDDNTAKAAMDKAAGTLARTFGPFVQHDHAINWVMLVNMSRDGSIETEAGRAWQLERCSLFWQRCKSPLLRSLWPALGRKGELHDEEPTELPGHVGLPWHRCSRPCIGKGSFSPDEGVPTLCVRPWDRFQSVVDSVYWLLARQPWGASPSITPTPSTRASCSATQSRVLGQQSFTSRTTTLAESRICQTRWGEGLAATVCTHTIAVARTCRSCAGQRSS